MGLSLVRAWRGAIRAKMRLSVRVLLAIVAYHTKHPTYLFLAPSEVTAIGVVVTLLETKLTATRMR
jgi:hypothetical protein